MKQFNRKLLSGLLALLMVLSLLPVVFAPKTAVAEAAAIDQEIVQGGAILHCFDWSYNEIKAHLSEIKAAGYVAVQTSPVQQPKDYDASYMDSKGQWWKLYQPLGLKIAPDVDGVPTSFLGTKAELTALCDEAEDLGIYVIVDIVANHLANKSGGGYYLNGEVNLSEQVDEEYQNHPEYFHTNTDGVNDGSRYNMTQNQMGMPDLNTSNEFIQQQVYNLLVECVDCGVDGFRFDAAKHIELPNDDDCGSDFWPTILNGDDTDGEIKGIRNYAAEKNQNLFIYGESLSGTASNPWVAEYTTYMALTDSQTGNAARDAVVAQNAGSLAIGTYTRGSNTKDYVLWAESHDTYETDNKDENTSGISSDNIVRTWAIVGSRANSTALYFARPNETMGLASSDTTWKSTAVAEVNKFKTHFDGTSEYLSFDYNNKVTWIERGTNGAVISKLDGAGSVSLTVSRMKDGSYVDQVTGNTFTVAGGVLSGTVDSSGVAVVYNTNEEATDGIDASTLYLVPGEWNKDGARFAMYVNDNDGHNAWVDMTADGDGIYKANVPEGTWNNVIFCRMNGTTTENNWDNKWNQTADLFPEPGSDTYTITGWDDGNGNSAGTWSRKGAEGYYLVGNMTNWRPAAAYQLTLVEDSNPVEYTVTVDLAADAQFKIAYSADGKSINDSNWHPTGMGNNYGENGELTEAGRYEVLFRPNHDGGDDWFYNCIKIDKVVPFVPTFEVQNLVLSGQIGVNFYMDLSGLSEEEREASYMMFEISGKGTTTEKDTFDANEMSQKGGYYGFTCYVSSIQMADKITPTFHYGNGLEVTRDAYSVEDYIKTFEEHKNEFNEKTVNLIHALADYGYYAQLFFAETNGISLSDDNSDENAYCRMNTYYAGEDYDYDTIKNEVDLAEKRFSKTLGDPNITAVTYSLMLDSETSIRVYLKPAEDFTGDVTARWDCDHAYSEFEAKPEYALTALSDGRYLVQIDNISAHMLSDTYTVNVWTGENCNSTSPSAYTKVQVSALSYVYAILNSAKYADNTDVKNGVCALYAYSQAANAYKAQNNN